MALLLKQFQKILDKFDYKVWKWKRNIQKHWSILIKCVSFSSQVKHGKYKHFFLSKCWQTVLLKENMYLSILSSGVFLLLTLRNFNIKEFQSSTLQEHQKSWLAQLPTYTFIYLLNKYIKKACIIRHVFLQET